MSLIVLALLWIALIAGDKAGEAVGRYLQQDAEGQWFCGLFGSLLTYTITIYLVTRR